MAKKKIEIWPLAIIIAMGLFMGSIVLAVTVMVNNDVPLVSDDYYAQEIAFQDRIDKEARMSEDGRKPAFKYLPASDAVELSLPQDSTAALRTGTLTFFRPSNPGKDFFVDLALDTAGKQWVDLRNADAGLWVMQLDWKEGDRSYYYEEKIEL